MSMTAPSNIHDRKKIISEAQNFVESTIDSQPEESVQKEAHSFDWVFSESRFVEQDSSPQQKTTLIGSAAHVFSPVEYLNEASSSNSFSKFSEIVGMNDVLHHLHNKSLHFQNGVKGFLQSGIHEALAGIKTAENITAQKSLVPSSLNELLAPEKLKTADPAALKESIIAVNKMFDALKSLQYSNDALKANMLQFVRC